MLEKLDYQEVGLISGLEVHQQLYTKEKLFCRCPGGLYTDLHDGEVLRHMRPTLSELGEYDGTALMEFKTKKEIVYLLNYQNVCTYEMDDTPPFLVNQEAIDAAIELCLMMNMDIIDEVHIARKQYLDGSIPTGFQRTAIVGVNGWLPFKGRRLTVTHVSVEEDSCREVRDRGHQIVWRTDRLGMPLTETVTGPELRTPFEVRDAILLCGLIARSTGRVRTGIGASREDVNVSVQGGARCEIKGVPRAGYAVKLVHNEGLRQYNLLKIRGELHKRGLVEPANIKMSSYEVTDIFVDVELGFVQRTLKSCGKIYAVKIEGVGGIAQHRTQTDATFLDELRGRVRVIACLDEEPIILGSTQMPEFANRHSVIERIRKRVKQAENDDFFIVFGPEQDCRTAAEEVRLRFCDATLGVPKETRQALVGGLTTFSFDATGIATLRTSVSVRRHRHPAAAARSCRLSFGRTAATATHALTATIAIGTCIAACSAPPNALELLPPQAFARIRGSPCSGRCYSRRDCCCHRFGRLPVVARVRPVASVIVAAPVRPVASVIVAAAVRPVASVIVAAAVRPVTSVIVAAAVRPVASVIVAAAVRSVTGVIVPAVRPVVIVVIPVAGVDVYVVSADVGVPVVAAVHPVISAVVAIVGVVVGRPVPAVIVVAILLTVRAIESVAARDVHVAVVRHASAVPAAAPTVPSPTAATVIVIAAPTAIPTPKASSPVATIAPVLYPGGNTACHKPR